MTVSTPQAPPPAAPAAAGPPVSGGGTTRTVLVVLACVAAALGAIALAVLALLAFVTGPRFLVHDVLDAGAVERGVTGVVTGDFHRGVTDVRCPGDQRTRPGVTFTCTATVDGRAQQVPVTVTDAGGTYEVGQPR